MLAVLLLGVNLALLLNMLLYPFSPSLHRRVGQLVPLRWVCYACHLLAKHFKFRFVYTGPDLNTLRRTVVIANHQSFFDITILFWLAGSCRQEVNLKWLAKDIFKHVPMVGWGAYLSGSCLFLHRNWVRDKGRLPYLFRYLLATRRPFWLTFFPEGTRITPAKRLISQNYSREKGYPVLDRVVIPRSKGLIAAVQGLRDNLDSLLDITISYSGGTPPTLATIAGGQGMQISVNGACIPVQDMPTSSSELRDWLLDRYVQKDKLLKQMSAAAEKI